MCSQRHSYDGDGMAVPVSSSDAVDNVSARVSVCWERVCEYVYRIEDVMRV